MIEFQAILSQTLCNVQSRKQIDFIFQGIPLPIGSFVGGNPTLSIQKVILLLKALTRVLYP